jgi:hypothetical protein
MKQDDIISISTAKISYESWGLMELADHSQLRALVLAVLKLRALPR